MKKIILIIIAVIVITGVVIGANIGGPKQGYYHTENATITYVNAETNEIFCTDENGEVWSFYGMYDFKVGDKVKIIFDTFNTETIYDDEIVNIVRI